jgi:peptidyl-prolyl cis-trans isomerase SurA
MRRFSCVTALAAALFLYTGCSRPVSKDVAATVNGRPITYADLDRAIAAQVASAPMKQNSDQMTQLRLEALRALIDNEILMQRAEKEGLLASDSDVDGKLSELKSPYTEEQFQKLLERSRAESADPARTHGAEAD